MCHNLASYVTNAQVLARWQLVWKCDSTARDSRLGRKAGGERVDGIVFRGFGVVSSLSSLSSLSRGPLISPAVAMHAFFQSPRCLGAPRTCSFLQIGLAAGMPHPGPNSEDELIQFLFKNPTPEGGRQCQKVRYDWSALLRLFSFFG